MLMGEFDFTTNFIKDTETPELAKVYFHYFSVTKMALTLPSKVFFLIFILLMALVFMNLLLGLAVSDIAELERVSCVSDQIFYTQTFPLPHRNLIKKRETKKSPYSNRCMLQK